MHLLQPQEVEVFYILPAIRKELSVALKARGKTQAEIARLLGVTPAAVSQYLHDKRAGTAFPRELRRLVENRAGEISDQESMIREVQRILERAKKTRLICRLHAQLTNIPTSCTVCFPEEQ